jgi:peptidoglycan/xylan/chitin deacetylase (PgdA/CDA1 family)
MRPLVRTATSFAAHFSGFSRLVAARYRGRGVILALHSVVDDDAFYPDHTLRCPAGRLEWALQWLRGEGLDFISLDEAVRRLSGDDPHPFACFAFDDGYADNLTRALPIMERFGAPFTVYVTSGMITREIDGWWLGLAALLRSRDRVELPGPRLSFECSDPAGKQRTFKTIESLVHSDFSMLPHLREAIVKSAIDCSALVDREALTEEQLRRLSRHPLVTIGGHTTTHQNLALASASTVRREMAENRGFLQDATGRPVAHFAYPFGHQRACGEREARICRDVGFRTAVTTRAGALFAEHAHDLHALPRLHLAGDDTASTLRCKLDGVYRAIHSRFGDPVSRM